MKPFCAGVSHTAAAPVLHAATNDHLLLVAEGRGARPLLAVDCAGLHGGA